MVPISTAAPAVSSPATVTVDVAPTPPVVNVQNVTLATNKRDMVTQIDVTFSGQVNATQADKTKIYRLAYPDRQGSSTPGNAVGVKLRSAKYNTATDSVTLTLSEAARAQGQGFGPRDRRNVAIRSPGHRGPLSRRRGQRPGREQCGHFDLQEWRGHRVKCDRFHDLRPGHRPIDRLHGFDAIMVSWD